MRINNKSFPAIMPTAVACHATGQVLSPAGIAEPAIRGRSQSHLEELRTIAAAVAGHHVPCHLLKQPIPSLLFLFTAILVGTGGLRAGVISGTVSPAKAGSVVYVGAIPGQEFTASATVFVMDQRAMLFKPHVLAVPLGSTVQFLNHDTTRHNVFWPNISGEHKMSHNLGSLRAGGVDTLRFKFDTPGVVPLRCNVHPDMSGFIIVSPTPYYAVTDASGNFRISGVPDGSYTVSAWHEGMRIQSKPVTVSGSAEVSFSLVE